MAMLTGTATARLTYDPALATVKVQEVAAGYFRADVHARGLNVACATGRTRVEARRRGEEARRDALVTMTADVLRWYLAAQLGARNVS